MLHTGARGLTSSNNPRYFTIASPDNGEDESDEKRLMTSVSPNRQPSGYGKNEVGIFAQQITPQVCI